jgi:transcriptional regulator with XRE-family HTH domain
MTQSTAAASYGTTQQQLSRWENGHVTPTVGNLYLLATTYRITPQQLLPILEGEPDESENSATSEAEKLSREAARAEH